MRRKLKNNTEVAEVWAKQSQAEGYTSNLFFEEQIIYSYGYHFPIARFIDNETVLLTSRGSSVSTSKHNSYVRRAILDKTIFIVPNVLANTKEEHKVNFEALKLETIKLQGKAKRAGVNKKLYIFRSLRIANMASDYFAMFIRS